MTRGGVLLRFIAALAAALLRPCRRGGGARLSEPRNHARGAVRRRQRHRPDRAYHWRRVEQGAQAAGRARPQTRSQRRDCGERGRACRTRWLHHLYDHSEHAFGKSQSAEKHSIRPGAGFRCAVAGRKSPVHARHRPQDWGNVGAGIHRLCEGQSWQAQLRQHECNWFGRGRDAQADGRPRSRARAVPKFSASHQRCDDRPSGDDVRRLRARFAAGEGGSMSAPLRSRPRSAARSCPTFHP